MQIELQAIKGKSELTHNLGRYYDDLRSFKNRRDYESSKLFRLIEGEIQNVENGLEWNNVIADQSAPESVRVCHWNIERGKNLQGILHSFQNDPVLKAADILLLSEADIGMGRSGNENVPKKIAETLGMNYCFSNSFLGLDRGDEGEQHTNLENGLALHGTAILSRYPIQGAVAVDLPVVKDHFHSREKRLGRRRALVCRIRLNGVDYDFASVHLDVFVTRRQRAFQLAGFLKVLNQDGLYDKNRGQIIGGDLNTCSFDLGSRFSLAQSLISHYTVLGFDKTIQSLMQPERHERHLFRALEHYGFNIHDLNDRNRGTHEYRLHDTGSMLKTKKYLPSFVVNRIKSMIEKRNTKVSLRLDWFAGRGIEAAHNRADLKAALPPQVVELPLYNGMHVSDHNPITFDFGT